MDGYAELHDRYRIDAHGNGTFSKVMEAIKLLKKYLVEFNVLTVLTEQTAEKGYEIYDFYKKNGFVYQQYIECIQPLQKPDMSFPFSLSSGQLAAFLKNLFDKWYIDIMKGEYVYIRYFENIIMLMASKIPESCTLGGKCGK